MEETGSAGGRWPGRPLVLRALALVGLLAGLVVVAEVTGLRAWVSVDSLRRFLGEAGPVGIVAFLAVFALSNLVSVPALVFVLAALVSFGGGLGLAVSFVGGLLAASTSFCAVRLVRGRARDKERVPASSTGRLARLLRPLDQHPVRTVALLRVLFVLSAPVNMALATSSRLRFSSYLLGTAVGLVPPLCFYSLTLECWLSL